MRTRITLPPVNHLLCCGEGLLVRLTLTELSYLHSLAADTRLPFPDSVKQFKTISPITSSEDHGILQMSKMTVYKAVDVRVTRRKRSRRRRKRPLSESDSDESSLLGGLPQRA